MNSPELEKLVAFLEIDNDSIDSLNLIDTTALIKHQQLQSDLLGQPNRAMEALLSLISEHKLSECYWQKISLLLSKLARVLAESNLTLLIKRLEQLERLMLASDLVPLDSKISLARLVNIFHDKHLDTFVANAYINSNELERFGIRIYFCKQRLSVPSTIQARLREIPGGEKLLFGEKR